MEKRDVYNINREKTGKVAVRGTNDLKTGEYNLVTIGWIFNSEGNFLMQKRSTKKQLYPGVYANHGGAAISEETSKQSMIREIDEEIGLKLKENELILLRYFFDEDSILDEYIVFKDVNINDLILDKEEVDSCKFFSYDELKKSIADEECFDYESNSVKPSLDLVNEYIKGYNEKSEISFSLMIDEIVPQQHYLSEAKLEKVKFDFEKYEDIGKIYVINYNNKFYSIDGHHRLFIAKQRGVKYVKVTMDFADNNHDLYLQLAEEADQLKLKTINDLGNRVLKHEDFIKNWIDKCQKILKEINILK